MHPLHELVLRIESDGRVKHLVSLPEWKFLQVCSDGLLQEPHAGTEMDGVYYSEVELHRAYFERNPDAEPLY